nr:serine/arginine-rich splicing factor SC35-like isoform X1 [Physcomitrium patens]|eukprot:XP_024389265.1 serine/arginine-rich splicing factor SC35-like isoform X1 [Physcomitrella patens]
MAMAPPHPLQPARSSLRAPPPFSRFSRRALLHADAVCAAAAAPHRLFVFSSLIVGIAVGARGAASGGTSADDLYPLFDRYGKVVDIFIPRDRRTGESRGFAFVRYKYSDEAQKAIERLDGRAVDGRNIVVQSAKYGRNDEPIHRGRITDTTVKKGNRSRSHSPRRSSRDRRYRQDDRHMKDTHHHSHSRDRNERESYRGGDRDDRYRGEERDRERGRDSRRRSASRSISRSRSHSRGRADRDVKRSSRSESDKPNDSPGASDSPSRGRGSGRIQRRSPERNRSVSRSPSRSLSRSPQKRSEIEEPMKEADARTQNMSSMDPSRGSESPDHKASPPRQVSASPGVRSRSPSPIQGSMSPEQRRPSRSPDVPRSVSPVQSDGA